MFIKSNRMLFGILLILIGVYILISPKIPALGSLPWLMLGAALLLLYFNKKKTWALVLGTILFELALFPALNVFGLHLASLPLVLFFFIPGTIFMILFLTKNAQGFLIPSSLLLWVGFGLGLRSFLGVRRGGPIILICVGMAFVTVYLLGNIRNSRNYLFIGLLIAALGGCSYISPGLSFGNIGWAAVIVLCAALFFKSHERDKNKDGEHGDG